MNGYFQVICNEGSTVLRVFPPKEEGEPVTLNEIAEYLCNKGIEYNSAVLRSLNTAETPSVIILNQEFHGEIKEGYKLDISSDKMSAAVRFYSPSVKGQKLNQKEFMEELGLKGIKFGIQEKNISEFFVNRRYCETIVVAAGKAPRHGTDAYIEYYFNTDLKVRPTLKDDGTVDFFHLNTINHCNKGDVIGRLFPEDPGEPGTDVYGEKIKARDVKKKILKYGRNILISEDKFSMISEVDGHVTLVEDKVFVSDVLTVENVDNSTGNIEFQGSVQVNGNVCTNFSVTAKGNIDVRGVVEGAFLDAGGDVVIARGINGMNKGKVKAAGNIIVKFMENTTAVAGGYVSAESILHSNVQAGDEITVSGKRGFITGGRVCAANKVTVKSLGSPMGADTIVEVGADPNMKMRISELQKKIGEATKVMRSVQPLLTATQQKLAKGVKLSVEQVQYMKSLIILNQAKKKEVEEAVIEMEQVQSMMGDTQNAQVVVTGVVFQGTRICIGDLSMIVQGESHYCRFVRADGDVKMTGM